MPLPSKSLAPALEEVDQATAWRAAGPGAGLQLLQNFANFAFFFFRAQAVEEALRKDRDCPVEKETPKRRGASGRKEAQPPPPDVESWSSSQC